MTKLQKINIFGLFLIGLAVITNPLTNQFVIEATERALIYTSREFGVYFTIAASIFIVGYMIYNMWATREKVSVPSKSKKTERAGKYVATKVQ